MTSVWNLSALKKIVVLFSVVFALVTCIGIVSAGEYYKMVDSWGGHGQENGTFQAPMGVATDAAGNVYVSDNFDFNDILSPSAVPRIQKFDADGTFVENWSPYISENYLKYGVSGIAVGGPSGDIYVNIVAINPPSSVDNTITMDNYVQIFDKYGKSRVFWGPYSSSIFGMNMEFQIPLDIAVDSAGNAYVTSMNLSYTTREVNSSVRKFTPAGTWSTFLGPTPPSGDSQGVYFGIDVAPSGEYIYITKSDMDMNSGSMASHIQKYNAGGLMLSEWDIQNVGDDQPDLAGGISVNSGGHIFIINSPEPFTLGEPRFIQEYAADGSYLTQGEAFGTGAGQIENPLLGPLGNIPLGIAIDPAGEYVYVVDVSTYQVLKFQKDVGSGANLVVGKTGPLWTRPGEPITYTIHYHNLGIEIAEDVTLKDSLDPNVDVIQSSAPYVYDAQTRSLTWTISPLPPGGHGMVNLVVAVQSSVPIGTKITNTVTIDSSTFDTQPGDNVASADTMVKLSYLPEGITVEPGNEGSDGVSVWYNSPIEFTYRDTAPDSCIDSIDLIVAINNDPATIFGSMTKDLNGIWRIKGDSFYPRYGLITITYNIHNTCKPDEQNVINLNVYIDPAGYVYDIDTGTRIPGASVWLQRPDGNGGWENVPTGVTPDAVMQPDENPLITNEYGQYQWDVLGGSYRVHVVAMGYLSADSIVVSIPPPVTDLHIGLKSNSPAFGSLNVVSTPPGAQIFIDGSSLGYVTSHTFGGITAGTHTVKVHLDGYADAENSNVVVTAGQITPVEFQLKALNKPPVANAGQDQTVIVNELIMFDGSGSTDSDGTITNYVWDFGDTKTGSGKTTSHIYTAAGTYTGTLIVTDNEGLTGSDTAVITVKTPAQTLKDLINKVDGIGLPKGIEQGLLAKLNTAEKKITQEQYTPARNTLNAFINEAKVSGEKP